MLMGKYEIPQVVHIPYPKDSRLEEFAKKQNLPAFTVFHDTTLIQMSSKKPVNEEQFLSLDGVGPAKLKKYGESFLNLIKTFN